MIEDAADYRQNWAADQFRPDVGASSVMSDRVP
jgi:hypothetical protein